MIYKGMKFRKTSNYVQMDSVKPLSEGDYVRFGKIIPLKKTISGVIPDNAEKTRYSWNDDAKTPVYAVEVEVSHSRTNLAYITKTGQALLMYDGMFFIAPKQTQRT